MSTSRHVALPGWEVIQRSLLAVPSDHDVDALYARGAVSDDIRSRVVVPSGSTVSFETYFGAFPAHVWRRYASLDRVRVSCSLDGPAAVSVHGTDIVGNALPVREHDVGGGSFELELEVDDRTAWLWVEVSSRAGIVTMDDLAWSARTPRLADASVAVAITTFNRVPDCIGVLSRLADDTHLTRILGRVIVVDQGSDAISDSPDFSAAAERLGERLHVIRQPNLGGSGGFSRGMLTAARGSERFVVLLDDDVRLETESLTRLAALAGAADHAKGPTIVGAHMLSATDPTVVHSWGERIERRDFWWAPVDPALSPVDVGTERLSMNAALSRPLDVDFNGWWMCLVPTATVRSIGASLPLFIKWDDAEYGLRASAAGVPTVTLPGAALWHMPWTAKDNSLDWQAYYHVRNRLVTACAHSGRPGPLLLALLAQDANHLLSMQYGSVRARHLAIRDVLSGSGHLWSTLATRRADVQRLLGRSGQLPHSEADGEPGARYSTPPAGSATVILLRGVIRQLRPTPPVDSPVETRVRAGSARWKQLGTVDSADLDSAAGTSYFRLRRNRRLFWSLLRDAVVLHAALAVRWAGLSAEYRATARSLASSASWDRLFEAGDTSA